MESFRKATGAEQSVLPVAVPATSGEKSLAAFFGHFPNICEVEEYMINEAMKLAKGNQGMAASLLGMSRQTLNNRLKNACRPE
jgi:DNA-binding NtrC family response regulator